MRRRAHIDTFSFRPRNNKAQGGQSPWSPCQTPCCHRKTFSNQEFCTTCYHLLGEETANRLRSARLALRRTYAVNPKGFEQVDNQAELHYKRLVDCAVREILAAQDRKANDLARVCPDTVNGSEVLA